MAIRRAPPDPPPDQSVESTKKITRAMELIATARIPKAQARVSASQALHGEADRGDPQRGCGRSGIAPVVGARRELKTTGGVAGDHRRIAAWPVATTRTVIRMAERSRSSDTPIATTGANVRLYAGGEEGAILLPVPRSTRSSGPFSASPTPPATATPAPLPTHADGRLRLGAVDAVEVFTTALRLSA